MAPLPSILGSEVLTNCRKLAERLADAARLETLPRFRNREPVYNKAGIWFDPVTEADRSAERAMRRMVQHVYPDHGILGEEFGEDLGARHAETGEKPSLRWVFDPVDGTRAFVTGTLSWMTLIALEYEGRPVLGLLDQPFTDERWICSGEVTLYHHGGEQLQCVTSQITELDKARLTTTDPRQTEAYFNSREADRFKELSHQCRVSRFSLDAYGYALLALGEMDLVVESGLARHDYAALVPVIEGAGGVITNWQGHPVGSDDRGETLAAATPELHQAAMAVLKDL